MEPICYFDGQFRPMRQLRLLPYDGGFMLGATIAEQLRTFRGEPFQVSAHLQRMWRGLQYVGISLPVSRAELHAIIDQVIDHNRKLIDPSDDLGITVFATPGPYPAYLPPGQTAQPTLAVHTFPLAFHVWADKYERGSPLAVVSVRQVPPECWPPFVKCRSRMHYFLASHEARQIDPQATALLLDLQGHVTETPTANLLAFDGHRLISPPADSILPGVSMQFLQRLAAELGVPLSHQPMTVVDLNDANELLLTSTSPGIIPVSRVCGSHELPGADGEMYRTLITAWSENVQVDMVAQANRFRSRPPTWETAPTD